jgi:phospholipid transport system substrate-binding protein
VLLGAATLAVVTRLRQDKHLQTSHPEKYAKLIETTVLPLFDFSHMTRLALGRHWHLASPAQQDALTDGFRTLLVHTYSTALTNYHEQVIEYKPPHMAPGETDVTVKSTVKPPGAERTAIDYDLEKTPAGWKIYDVSISGISLVSTYRSSFAETIRDSGVDGLIEWLATRTRQIDAAPRSDEDGAGILVLMYSAIQNFFHSIR